MNQKQQVWKHGDGTMFYCVGNKKDHTVQIFLPMEHNPEQRIMYLGLDKPGWTSTKIIPPVIGGRGTFAYVKVLTDDGHERWVNFENFGSRDMTISMWSVDHKIPYFILKVVDAART